jgi:alkylated DNA repair dioxygenase AlkB
LQQADGSDTEGQECQPMKDDNDQSPGLFDEVGRDALRVSERLEMPDAEVILYRTFFTRDQSDAFYEELSRNAKWKQEQIKFYGKLIDLPRLTAWYGDEGKTYSYSGITVHPEPWTPSLLAIKREIEAVSGAIFNSVLLNFYRGERDSVAWHADDESELGHNPVIGSVSFGGTRAFELKHKRNKSLRMKIDLGHGSYLLMRGPTQHHWLHQVPKEKKPRQPRINLTFRVIR